MEGITGPVKSGIDHGRPDEVANVVGVLGALGAASGVTPREPTYPVYSDPEAGNTEPVATTTDNGVRRGFETPKQGIVEPGAIPRYDGLT